jgi:hypothetical protein
VILEKESETLMEKDNSSVEFEGVDKIFVVVDFEMRLGNEKDLRVFVVVVQRINYFSYPI